MTDDPAERTVQPYLRIAELSTEEDPALVVQATSIRADNLEWYQQDIASIG